MIQTKTIKRERQWFIDNGYIKSTNNNNLVDLILVNGKIEQVLFENITRALAVFKKKELSGSTPGKLVIRNSRV